MRGSSLSLTYECTCKIIFCKRLENCQICFWSDFDFRLHRKTETSCKNVTLLSINRNSWQRPYWQYKFDLLTKFKPVYEIRWQDSYNRNFLYVILFFETKNQSVRGNNTWTWKVRNFNMWIIVIHIMYIMSFMIW